MVSHREEQEMQIFEIIMLLCFGMSWPISVYKSIRSKSTKGKSAVFIIAAKLCFGADGSYCRGCGKETL